MRQLFHIRRQEAHSDIDIVVVRPTHIDEDDERWTASLEAWRCEVRRIAGNPVEILEVGVAEAAAKLAGRGQLWQAIRRDGLVVFGVALPELRSAS